MSTGASQQTPPPEEMITRMAASTPRNLSDVFEQVEAFEAKALKYVTDVEAPVVDYVGKTAEALAARLPEDRPEALEQGIEVLLAQVSFAKKVLDSQVRFSKAVLDAAVKPLKPAPAKPKTVKAA